MRIRHRPRCAQILGGLALSLGLWVAACAGVPYQQMSDARQAIESARPVVADHPGPRARVQEARSLLEQAETHLEAGEYGAARETAEQAKQLAIEARDAVAQDRPNTRDAGQPPP